MKNIYLKAIPLATLGLMPVPASAQSSDELKEIDEATRKNQELLKKAPKINASTTKSEGMVADAGNNNVSVVVSTPVAILILLVGGLALFPLVHVFWKSQEKENNSNSLLARLTAKWRRPTVLDSDAFIHKRDWLSRTYGEYAILRGISSTINEVTGETVLDFDRLLTVVLQKADLFTKFGAIVGVQDDYNQPEVYAKMIQYMGLQTRHEAAYDQFQSLLKLLRTWEGHAKTVTEVRSKYNAVEYKLPKEFTVEIPGSPFYEKYQQVMKSTDKTTEPAAEKVPALA